MIRNAFIRIATSLPAVALLACTVGPVYAQTATPETPFTRQIHRLDLGITGVGIYNTTVQGPIVPSQASDAGQTVTQFGSNTAGVVASVRYVAKPYVGFEFNYGYARYTENYTVVPYQIQTKVNEYTLGYVATPNHQIFGLQPYLGGGAGPQAFKPTSGGGQGAPEKARMTYYYSVGFQKPLGEGHFGLRAGFRQLFFLDPDFGQNYLTILKHASSYEPQAGFYLRY